MKLERHGQGKRGARSTNWEPHEPRAEGELAQHCSASSKLLGFRKVSQRCIDGSLDNTSNNSSNIVSIEIARKTLQPWSEVTRCAQGVRMVVTFRLSERNELE